MSQHREFINKLNTLALSQRAVTGKKFILEGIKPVADNSRIEQQNTIDKIGHIEKGTGISAIQDGVVTARDPLNNNGSQSLEQKVQSGEN